MIFDKDASRGLRSEIAQYFPAVWGFAVSISGSTDAADDLAQATCLQALEQHHRFEAGYPVIVMLIEICRSIWLHELRAERICKTGRLDAASEIADLREGPETSIFAAQVYAKIMELPVGQRVTVELVYVQQFTYSEAADILDVPLGTVMSRLSTARNALAGLKDPERKGHRAGCMRA